jgi:hypothetical protein
MGRIRGLLFVALLAAVFTWQTTPFAAGGEEVPRMTKEQLKVLLGNPDLIVIDVRFEGKSATKKIAGAVIEDPGKVDVWAASYPKGKKIVLYCS